ncbi:hypothetical protein AB0J71_46410 [Nonomuraea sp. NPDC049637]|uniref:hypothetical protein n=1 Tax=Nonomuraea sp. NPDC049637 TaxID=3154356 RepID=UPI0034189589
MSPREMLSDLAAIRHPMPVATEYDETTSESFDAAVAGVEEARAAFMESLEAAWGASGPGFDPLLAAIQDLVAVKKEADTQIRLLLAYGRTYVTPRPYTLETLGQSAGLSPSGASRAFGADEVVEVGDRTGLRPPAAKIEDYDSGDPRLGQASRTRCTWGGGNRNNLCANPPKYTVIDKSGTPWACCDDHLPRYLASRPRG